MPLTAVQIPLGVYLPPILAQSFGLPLAMLGIIFLTEKLWGALADPIVGALSDRTRSRFGRRRIWILAGAMVFAVSGLFLFFPPAGVTPLYLILVLFAFYLGWSMMQIPYFAWSGEVSGDYHERTRIATYQQVSGSIAMLLLLIVPTVIDQLRPGAGALKLWAMGALILAMVALGLAPTLRAFADAPAPPQSVAARRSFLFTAHLVLMNPLLMRVLAADFSVMLGQSIRGALFVFFVTSYMELPKWASGLFLVQFLFGIGAGPLWMRVGYRLGKHRAAVAGELTQVAINLALLLVAPRALPLLLALTIAQGLAQGSGNLMLRAMVADVADEHRLATGADRTALFFSVFSVSMKIAMAAAVGIALPLVATLGFDPHASSNSPQALRGLLLVFTLGPALAHGIAAASVAGFPLDATMHAEIRRRLDEREAKPLLTN